PKTGQDYMLTVQYPELQVKSLNDLRAIPLRGPNHSAPTRLDTISQLTRIKSPTEVDHYALRRTMDIYVRSLNEDLGKIAASADDVAGHHHWPAADGVEVGRGQRSLCAFGARYSGRAERIRRADGVSGARRLHAGLRRKGVSLGHALPRHFFAVRSGLFRPS